MTLLNWFNAEEEAMEGVFQDARRLREEHGSDAEHWIDREVQSPHTPRAKRKTLKQVKRALSGLQAH